MTPIDVEFKEIKNDSVAVEFQEVKSEEKKTRRGGRRPGAGRPSLVRENKARMEQGLPPLPEKSKINNRVAKRKSEAILPQSKKARAQEVLAEMLGRKGKYIVQKVLDKALNDDDPDQMACLKLVMDRVIPQDYMTKAKGGSGGVTIQIMGVDAPISINEDPIDVDFEEVEEDGG
jgi:hypothetical protein